MKIIESIPNISEGRDLQIVEACVAEIKNTAGCTLMDYSSDSNHNRSVISYMGSPEAMEEASVKLAKKAAELIDLTKQNGEHPRMGAVDVMPFVPIREATTDDCIVLSKKIAGRIAEEAKIPVFLYEQSATAENRKNLAHIRKGGFEGMADKVKEDVWKPDFGGRTIHPTAGVVAVGARKPLIAYNINLSTSDINIANKISKIVRQSGGGLDEVKAIGIFLEDRNTAQVSLNMTDYMTTPLYRVVELVKAEAARYGVAVIGTELIGLCPMKAMLDVAEYYLQIEDFKGQNQIIENYLL